MNISGVIALDRERCDVRTLRWPAAGALHESPMTRETSPPILEIASCTYVHYSAAGASPSMFESLNDPIDVLTVFAEGRLEPLRFRWKGKVLRIHKVTGRWSRREGQTLLRYFSVESGSESFEMCYDPRGPRWFLSRAWLSTS